MLETSLLAWWFFYCSFKVCFTGTVWVSLFTCSGLISLNWCMYICMYIWICTCMYVCRWNPIARKLVRLQISMWWNCSDSLLLSSPLSFNTLQFLFPLPKILCLYSHPDNAYSSFRMQITYHTNFISISKSYYEHCMQLMLNQHDEHYSRIVDNIARQI